MTATALKLVNRKGFDSADFQRLLGFVGITDKAAVRAGRRALDKTATWLKRRFKAAVSSEMDLPVQFVRQRMQTYRTTQTKLYSKVWLGLDLLNAELLGKTSRQTKKGLRIGRFTFAGAFKSRVYGKGEKGWIRKNSKHFDEDLYPHRTNNKSVPDELKGRFPVVKIRVDPKEADDIFQQLQVEAEAHLHSLIVKELKVEMTRAAARA